VRILLSLRLDSSCVGVIEKVILNFLAGARLDKDTFGLLLKLSLLEPWKMFQWSGLSGTSRMKHPK